MFSGERPLVTVPDDRWLDLWDGAAGPVELVRWDLDSPPADGVDGEDLAGRVDLVVMPYVGAARVVDRLSALSRLRMVQLLTAGYEDVLAHLPEGVLLANAAGVHDTATAELAVGLCIAALRGIGDFARAQPQGRWLFERRRGLADARVLVIGAGHIGEAIASRLAPFEVSLTRLASRARDDAAGRVHGVEELPELLPVHDVVILVLPLTDSTRRLVDAPFLAAMPDGALLVNVARGPIVDTDALLAEVSTGRLRVALDVTDPEPLPPGHPLWTAPNTLITPHVGGNTSAFAPRARALLRRQLEAFAAGGPVSNVVAVGGRDD